MASGEQEEGNFNAGSVHGLLKPPSLKSCQTTSLVITASYMAVIFITAPVCNIGFLSRGLNRDFENKFLK